MSDIVQFGLAEKTIDGYFTVQFTFYVDDDLCAPCRALDRDAASGEPRSLSSDGH